MHDLLGFPGALKQSCLLQWVELKAEVSALMNLSKFEVAFSCLLEFKSKPVHIYKGHGRTCNDRSCILLFPIYFCL